MAVLKEEKNKQKNVAQKNVWAWKWILSFKKWIHMESKTQLSPVHSQSKEVHSTSLFRKDSKLITKI